MDIEELLKYDRLGFIPGPGESEKKFLERVNYCQSLDLDLEETPTLFKPSEQLKHRLEKETGFTLDWVPLIYSNKGLALWHGGCAWIFQKEATSPKGAFFQLRKAFAKQERVFGYTKEEILIHESVHVARMEFEEPKFEEFLAYRTSKNRFRSYLGPIITKPIEVVIFFIALLIPFLFLTQGDLLWPWVIPFVLVLGALYRLIKRHTILESCFQKLVQITGSQQRANVVLYRLTDKEIENFAKLSLDKLKAFIYCGCQETLRQRVVNAMTIQKTI